MLFISTSCKRILILNYTGYYVSNYDEAFGLFPKSCIRIRERDANINRCAYGFSPTFKLPFIFSSSPTLEVWELHLFHLSLHASYQINSVSFQCNEQNELTVHETRIITLMFSSLLFSFSHPYSSCVLILTLLMFSSLLLCFYPYSPRDVIHTFLALLFLLSCSHPYSPGVLLLTLLIFSSLFSSCSHPCSSSVSTLTIMF